MLVGNTRILSSFFIIFIDNPPSDPEKEHQLLQMAEKSLRDNVYPDIEQVAAESR